MTDISIGSVSTDTLRPEDLIPRFLAVLDDILVNRCTHPDRDEIDDAAGEVIQRIDDGSGYFASDRAADDLDWLIETLGEFAPPYCYFGTHIGDGADFGFWVNWNAIDDAIKAGEIIMCNPSQDWTASLSSNYNGYVIEDTHDRLWSVADGVASEVWAVV